MLKEHATSTLEQISNLKRQFDEHRSKQEKAEKLQADLVAKLTSVFPDTSSMQGMLKEHATTLDSTLGDKLREMRKPLENGIPDQLSDLLRQLQEHRSEQEQK